MDKYLLVKEVAAEINESVHTVRNWVRDFREHIPLVKNDVGYNQYGPDAVAVLMTIKRLHRDHGYTGKQISYYLDSGGKAFAEEVAAAAPALEEISEIKEMLRQQLEFNRRLIERLDEQQQNFEKWTQERDALITKTLRDMQEQRRLLSDSKRPFWQGWFKK